MGHIQPEEIDAFAISRDVRANLSRKLWFALWQKPALGLLRDRLDNSMRVRNLCLALADDLGLGRSSVGHRLHYVEHHPAHLASSFFVSPFEEATVCAIDGFGDFVSTSWAVGRGRSLEVLERVYFPHSLGLVYLAITQYLGFLKYGDEYKVMGLAPYGEPDYVDVFRQLMHLKP